MNSDDLLESIKMIAVLLIGGYVLIEIFQTLYL